MNPQTSSQPWPAATISQYSARSSGEMTKGKSAGAPEGTQMWSPPALSGAKPQKAAPPPAPAAAARPSFPSSTPALGAVQLACEGRVAEAVRCLLAKGLFPEALLLARLRLPEMHPLLAGGAITRAWRGGGVQEECDAEKQLALGFYSEVEVGSSISPRVFRAPDCDFF